MSRSGRLYINVKTHNFFGNLDFSPVAHLLVGALLSQLVYGCPHAHSDAIHVVPVHNGVSDPCSRVLSSEPNVCCFHSVQFPFYVP